MPPPQNVTPLMIASIDDSNITKVARLLREGVNVNALDSKGSSALIYATQNSDPAAALKIVRLLLTAGADTLQTDANGYDALHYALRMASGQGDYSPRKDIVEGIAIKDGEILSQTLETQLGSRLAVTPIRLVSREAATYARTNPQEVVGEAALGPEMAQILVLRAAAKAAETAPQAEKARVALEAARREKRRQTGQEEEAATADEGTAIAEANAEFDTIQAAAAARTAANTSEAGIGNVPMTPPGQEQTEDPDVEEQDPSSKVPKGGRTRKTRKGKAKKRVTRRAKKRSAVRRNRI